MSLYDVVAADVDVLDQVTATELTDERVIAMPHRLDAAERQVVLGYAYGEGTTWTEAAAHAGATEPEAFGERVRRKTKRLAAEQHRRAAARGPIAVR